MPTPTITTARARSTLAALLTALGAACGGETTRDATPPAVHLGSALGGDDVAGYERATAPPELTFPRDHGPHARFRTEWWYVTSNLTTAAGRRFGVQLVFFRQAMAPEVEPRAASLAARDLVLAHAAVTDVDAGRFHHAERLVRAAGGLACTQLADDGTRLVVQCADWSMVATTNGATDVPPAHPDATRGLLPLRLKAQDGTGFAFDLLATPGKRLVLHGDRGLSQKSDEAGNASIYYSLTRLPIAGRVTTDGVQHDVEGLAWLDREWSTSALGDDQVGWDWFSLQLDDGSDVMWYQLRRQDGTPHPRSRGTFVAADGAATTIRTLDAEPLGTWTAADGRASYPAAFRLRCADPPLELTVTPLVADQELRTTVRYWEGAVDVRGQSAGRDVAGRGYLEMTGYAR
jgi:predicted secreted hydrolase